MRRLFSLLTGFLFFTLSLQATTGGVGSSLNPLGDLTLTGMVRTVPLPDLSSTLQETVLLSRTQSQKLIVLMHLFLGRLGFPHFEVFSKIEDVSFFSLKDETGRLHNLGVLRFDEDRVQEDPNIENLYRGLFAQMGLVSKAFGGYELVARDPRVLEYFADENYFKRLRRIQRHQPHRYDIEVTAFNPSFSPSLELLRGDLFQSMGEVSALSEKDDGVELLMAVFQVLFEELRELESFHLGFTLNEAETRLGLMGSVTSGSDLGTYLKQPIPQTPSSLERYLPRDVVTFSGRWNTRAYNVYEDRILERLEVYTPASKTFLWSRSANLLNDFRQALTGVWAGSTSIHYDRIASDFLLRPENLATDAMSFVSSQYVYGAAGLQASSASALIQFATGTLASEFKEAILFAVKTQEEAQSAPLSLGIQGIPLGMPLFDFTFERDKDIYLERPIHTLTYQIYDANNPKDVLWESSEHIGVLAQGVVSTSDEEDLRPLMERVKRDQAVEGSAQGMFSYDKHRLFDLSLDVKRLMASFLKESPLFAAGPYALEDADRDAFYQKIQAQRAITPLRLRVDTQRSLVDVQLRMDTQSLRTALNISEDYAQALNSKAVMKNPLPAEPEEAP